MASRATTTPSANSSSSPAGRRTHATQELHRAIADVEQAEQALLRAEQEVLLRERHVAMCDRSIEGLLDEELHAAGARV